ncbi:MAG: hypothetical protein LBD15_01050 [Holosporales bacterium]|jgi:hypothetical protein|nr:hypothetical protein [Holosporales bacterium]
MFLLVPSLHAPLFIFIVVFPISFLYADICDVSSLPGTLPVDSKGSAQQAAKSVPIPHETTFPQSQRAQGAQTSPYTTDNTAIVAQSSAEVAPQKAQQEQKIALSNAQTERSFDRNALEHADPLAALQLFHTFWASLTQASEEAQTLTCFGNRFMLLGLKCSATKAYILAARQALTSAQKVENFLLALKVLLERKKYTLFWKLVGKIPNNILSNDEREVFCLLKAEALLAQKEYRQALKVLEPFKTREALLLSTRACLLLKDYPQAISNIEVLLPLLNKDDAPLKEAALQHLGFLLACTGQDKKLEALLIKEQQEMAQTTHKSLTFLISSGILSLSSFIERLKELHTRTILLNEAEEFLKYLKETMHSDHAHCTLCALPSLR